MDLLVKIIQMMDIPHQFKFLALHGNKMIGVIMVVLEQLKLMEHYGHGELVIMEY